jgi:hypothetical protein
MLQSKRRVLRTLSLCALIVSPSPASAKGANPTILKTFPLAMRTDQPTFVAADELRVVNRQRMLYMGSGMWKEQQTFYLRNLKDFSRVSVTAPVVSYIRKNRGMLLDESDTRPILEQFNVRKLLFYDAENGEAGIEIADKINSKVKRHFYLHWDLRKNKITEVTLVVRSAPKISWATLWPIGYDPDSCTFYYLRDIEERGKDRQPHTVTIIAFTRGKAKVVSRFDATRSIFRRVYFDSKRLRAMPVEYGEKGTGTGSPNGFLVDLKTGKVKKFEVPFTTYGASFDPSGDRVFAYSSQLGKLWSIRLSDGAVLKRLSVGALGHALGRLNGKELVLIRNSGILRLKRTPLRKGRFTRMAKLYPGFSHVEGSLVLNDGRFLVKNGERLYLVKF